MQKVIIETPKHSSPEVLALLINGGYDVHAKRDGTIVALRREPLPRPALPMLNSHRDDG